MFGLISDPMAWAVSDAASIAYMDTKLPSAELLEVISPNLHISKHTPQPSFGQQRRTHSAWLFQGQEKGVVSKAKASGR